MAADRCSSVCLLRPVLDLSPTCRPNIKKTAATANISIPKNPHRIFSDMLNLLMRRVQFWLPGNVDVQMQQQEQDARADSRHHAPNQYPKRSVPFSAVHFLGIDGVHGVLLLQHQARSQLHSAAITILGFGSPKYVTSVTLTGRLCASPRMVGTSKKRLCKQTRTIVKRPSTVGENYGNIKE